MNNRTLSAAAFCLALLVAAPLENAFASPSADHSVKYDFDTQNYLVRHETPEFVSELEREATNGRLLRFRQFRVSDWSLQHDIGFEYDAKGCLIRVAESARAVRFIRRAECDLQIALIDDLDASVTYAENDDLTIEMPGVGSIHHRSEPDDETPKYDLAGDWEQVMNRTEPVVRWLKGISERTCLDWLEGVENNDCPQRSWYRQSSATPDTATWREVGSHHEN
jgi:hypothetical protein